MIKIWLKKMFLGTDKHGLLDGEQEIILHVELVLYSNHMCQWTVCWLSIDSAIIKITI